MTFSYVNTSQRNVNNGSNVTKFMPIVIGQGQRTGINDPYSVQFSIYFTNDMYVNEMFGSEDQDVNIFKITRP